MPRGISPIIELCLRELPFRDMGPLLVASSHLDVQVGTHLLWKEWAPLPKPFTVDYLLWQGYFFYQSRILTTETLSCALLIIESLISPPLPCLSSWQLQSGLRPLHCWLLMLRYWFQVVPIHWNCTLFQRTSITCWKTSLCVSGQMTSLRETWSRPTTGIYRTPNDRE